MEKWKAVSKPNNCRPINRNFNFPEKTLVKFICQSSIENCQSKMIRTFTLYMFFLFADAKYYLFLILPLFDESTIKKIETSPSDLKYACK